MAETPPKRLTKGLRYINRAFNSLRDYVVRSRVIPVAGWTETDQGLLPPPASAAADGCTDLRAALTDATSPASLTVSAGVIWANIGDREAGYDGVPDIGAGTVESDPPIELVAFPAGKLWLEITIGSNDDLNKISASEFVYLSSTPTETLPDSTSTGVLYLPWATVTYEDGEATLTRLQCGSKHWQYCGGGAGQLIDYV